MSDFYFDKIIVCKEHATKISVTRCDEDDDSIQFRMNSAVRYHPGPEIAWFLGLDAAEALGRALLEAVNAKVSA